jgi:glycosidase
MRPGSFMPGVENVKMAAGVMAMLNGGCFVYYGEEIGMISKDGSNSDPHKRIAMNWSNKSVYEGWCYNTPENIKIDDTYYYYPSVEEQLQDEQSILNYYKIAMRLRNAFPSIARGKVTDYSSNYSSYVCVVTKEYAGELITIVINLDSFEQNISLDQSALNVTSIAGELYATNEGKAALNGTNLVIPPYAIVILK